jgi:hypothetical protein
MICRWNMNSKREMAFHVWDCSEPCGGLLYDIRTEDALVPITVHDLPSATTNLSTIAYPHFQRLLRVLFWQNLYNPLVWTAASSSPSDPNVMHCSKIWSNSDRNSRSNIVRAFLLTMTTNFYYLEFLCYFKLIRCDVLFRWCATDSN